MTFDQIKRMAAQQLDEDPADMDELSELLTAYVNEGYQIALRDYVRPRERFTCQTDKMGHAPMGARRILRVVELMDGEGRYVPFAISADGQTIETGEENKTLFGVAEVAYPDMKAGSDVPRMDETAHMALCDYACWRYLCNGNLAKQSRAQHYQQRFYAAMRALRPQGMGSVTGYRGLYAVTDARFVR